MKPHQVIITKYTAASTTSGPTKYTVKSKGLAPTPCECGAHVWCLPYDDGAAVWESHQRSPVRDIIEKHGMAPPQPRITHHVVFASPEDAKLLRDRRWRVYPSKAGTLHRVELRGGTRRGLPLQRHVMGREACVRVINRYGCDVRRENLKRMTRKEIAAERVARIGR